MGELGRGLGQHRLAQRHRLLRLGPGLSRSVGTTEDLGEVVAANTGVSKSDAEQRVRSTFQEAKQATGDARKASAWVALWLAVSLFVGAFVASVAAIFGGRLRDSAALAVTP